MRTSENFKNVRINSFLLTFSFPYFMAVSMFLIAVPFKVRVIFIGFSQKLFANPLVRPLAKKHLPFY
jgi:hypothetical protein